MHKPKEKIALGLSMTRSENMRRVRNRNTTPERLVRSLLHKHGFRFRLHRRDLPGTPDILLPRHRLAIFVNGCFWHGHSGCKRAKLPSTRMEFWEAKIRRNVERDRAAIDALATLGFKTVTLWQCELTKPETVLKRIQDAV